MTTPEKAYYKCTQCLSEDKAFRIPHPLDPIGVAMMREHLWAAHQIRPGTVPKGVPK